MEVRDISFIGRELSAFHSKPLVYLHYIVQREKYVKKPGSAYPSLQYILRKHPCDDKVTDEAIIKAFLQMMNSPMSVTQKVKYLVFVKEFQLEYPGYLDDVETYPNYKVTVTNISNASGRLPDKSIVWDLNHICPELCGMFFENLVSHANNLLRNDEYGVTDIGNLSDCLLDLNDNTTMGTIANLLKRRFIDKTLDLSYDQCILTATTDSSAHELCEEDFLSIYHALLFRALKHFWKYNCEGKWYEAALSMIEYIETNKSDIENYEECLKDSTISRILQREQVTHGEHIVVNDTSNIFVTGLHGETDFSSKSLIADCKVQKEPTEEKWFVQLYLYRRIMEHIHHNKPSKLIIIDLYDNQLYSFTEA